MAGQQFVEAPPLNAPNKVTTVTTPSSNTAPPTIATVVPTPDTPKDKIEAPSIKSSDILSRQSAKVEENPTPKETNYREDLEKITDPTVRAIAEKQLKDLESGYNKKFQDLATQRKEFEAKMSQMSTWTPERVAQELKNPAFVQAAQAYQQQFPPQEWTGTGEEWSTLSESEKKQFQQMRQETSSLQSQMAKMLQAQEDTEIKKSYPDYDPKVVDEAIDGLRTGQIVASRADIWKVVNHDKNVEKGYQFGYEDGYKKALEKMNGNSVAPGNTSIVNADEVPEDIKKGGFSSIAMWRLNRSKNGAKK